MIYRQSSCDDFSVDVLLICATQYTMNVSILTIKAYMSVQMADDVQLQ